VAVAFLDRGTPLPIGFLDDPKNVEYLLAHQEASLDNILRNKRSLLACTSDKMTGTYRRSIARQTNRLVNLGALGDKLAKRIPGIRYGATIILFAADAGNLGAAGATANATPIVGDLLGIQEDLREYYTDLADDVATAEQMLNADVAHGAIRATEMFGKFVAYEIEQRSCHVFDTEKLNDALGRFYHELFSEYRNEVNVSLERRGIGGLGFPVTVDRSRVGTANINDIVNRFQQHLNEAVVR